MNLDERADQILIAARNRIGRPFINHFKPKDLCEGGALTLGSCMDRGTDDTGYDCSGLVVASFCDVLGIATSKWPKPLRHLGQMSVLGAENQTPMPGDVVIYYQEPSAAGFVRSHMGISTIGGRVVHASGISRVVEEGVIGEWVDESLTIKHQDLLASLPTRLNADQQS